MIRKIIFWILIALVIAVFTGTWVFGIGGSIFHGVGKFFDWLCKIFNFFGWNKGILSVSGGLIC